MNSYHLSKEELAIELKQIKAAQKNPKHFDVLYDKYYKLIFVFIYKRVDDENISADITSTVFLKALINIKKYKDKGLPFSSWLFRIAFNETNMHFRATNRTRTISIEESGIVLMVKESHIEEHSEALNKMKDAIAQLDEKALHFIELRFFEQHSFAEVGNILGITENNAKVKTYRILDKLKRIIKKRRD